MKKQDEKRLDPEDERAQLVASVKSDNAEVAAMEQQIKEILSQTEKLQNELQEVDNVSLSTYYIVSHRIASGRIGLDSNHLRVTDLVFW